MSVVFYILYSIVEDYLSEWNLGFGEMKKIKEF